VKTHRNEIKSVERASKFSTENPISVTGFTHCLCRSFASDERESVFGQLFGCINDWTTTRSPKIATQKSYPGGISAKISRLSTRLKIKRAFTPSFLSSISG